MPHFVIIETATGKSEHTIPVKGKSKSQIDRLERALLLRINAEKYHVEFVPATTRHGMTG